MPPARNIGMLDTTRHKLLSQSLIALLLGAALIVAGVVVERSLRWSAAESLGVSDGQERYHFGGQKLARPTSVEGGQFSAGSSLFHRVRFLLFCREYRIRHSRLLE
jgi:hypothetical protein